MTIPRNEAEKRALIKELLEKQIKLEMQFRPKLSSLFKDIGRDAAANYVANRRLLDVRTFNPDMVALLRSQYRKTIRQFGFLIRDSIRTATQKQINEKFQVGSSEYIVEQSNRQTPFIMQTEQKNVNKAIINGLIGLLLIMEVPQDQIAATTFLPQIERIQALQSMVDSNNALTQEQKDVQLERLIRREVNAITPGQVVGVALTETNNAANFAMDLENDLASEDEGLAIAAVSAGIVAEEELRNGLLPLAKIWVTVGDLKVRATHVRASGQIRPTFGVFNVGGARLRFPSDTALGAPAEEVANCRCKSIPVLVFRNEKARGVIVYFWCKSIPVLNI